MQNSYAAQITAGSPSALWSSTELHLVHERASALPAWGVRTEQSQLCPVVSSKDLEWFLVRSQRLSEPGLPVGKVQRSVSAILQ